MNTMTAIKTRKSIRKFTDQPVPQKLIIEILKAGMSGPTCVNARPWAFISVTDKTTLNKMADANGIFANPLRSAAFGILVCGDLERAFKISPDYWIIDASIAAQNMILAAHSLGIESVWLGTYPQTERVTALSKLFNLPKPIIPHSILAFGYASNKSLIERDLFEADRVHFEKW